MKKAEFEIPGNLLYAILVAVLIIVFYFTTAELTKEESGKIYGTEGSGNGAAYVALKKICANWVSYVELCPSCDCTNCKDAFLQELSVFSAYYAPYYVSASGLAAYDAGTNEFSPNGELCSGAGNPDCGTKSAKCAEALTAAMGVSPMTSDFTGEIKKALYPATNDAALKSEAKARRDLLRNDYSEPCATLCRWVVSRAQNCALGAEECAGGLPGDLQSQNLP